jgi:mxaJ protein
MSSRCRKRCSGGCHRPRASAWSRINAGETPAPTSWRKRATYVSVIFAFASRLCAQDDCCVPKEEPRPADAPTNKRILRVTSDPNNLPFSNEKREGFENKIAELIAKELGADLQYSWRAQRRGFFRETLKENRADLVLGVPAHFDMALTTAPYYRSSYVFVYRKDRNLRIQSLDDPALHKLRIGVQMIGNDETNTPPAHALAHRGIVDNVVAYTLYGDYREPNPPARIVDAVVKGEVDVAVVWGPLAGYFAKQASVPLEVVPVSPAADPSLPFTFSIAMGVRKGDKPLHDEIDAILQRKHKDIDAILDEFGVPRVSDPPKQVAAAK